MSGEGSNARTLLVAGTASHVGKSTVAAGLCRSLADRGVAVAPFKAQNMSNNARAVVTPDGGYGEVGVSQFVQARAARITPTTDCNPVLLKPRGDGESQLVIDGRAVGHFEAGSYYDEHWDRAREAARRAHDRLAERFDVIIAEGAGSIAEINLHDRDLANVETARFADADVVLVGDIERGGVFASLYGTLELMPDDLRDRVCGVVITKFRGDRSLLQPGIERLETMTGVPVLGVVPHDDPGLPAEDSVDLPADGELEVRGDDDGIPSERSVTVGVVRLPRISNFTDVEPLVEVPGVRVAYLPPDASLAGVDAAILPGTKNTVDDLIALREAGFDDELRSFEGPIVGICGGYQMLGERILDADIEATGEPEEVAGLGLLPVVTEFTTEKEVKQTTVEVSWAGPVAPPDDGTIAGGGGDTGTGDPTTASGYEIHMGRTTVEGSVDRPLGDHSAAQGSVLGTYLHGLFGNDRVREAFVEAVYRAAGTECPSDRRETVSPYEDAATLVGGTELPETIVAPGSTGPHPNR